MKQCRTPFCIFPPGHPWQHRQCSRCLYDNGNITLEQLQAEYRGMTAWLGMLDHHFRKSHPRKEEVTP
jgi:hypothetical protein